MTRARTGRTAGPTYRPARRALIAGLATALLAPPLLVSTPASAGTRHVASEDCRDVVIVGARGSGESLDSYGGFGRTTDRYADRFVGRLRAVGDDRTVTRQHVPFAARGVRTLPHRPGRYLGGIDRRVRWVGKWVPRRLRACPDEQVVLVGYSQGAMVMHRSLARIKAAAPGSVGRVTTLLISDGYRPRRSRVDTRGSARDTARGVYRALAGRNAPRVRDVPRAFRGRTVAACVAGDIVCDYKDGSRRTIRRGRRVHTSYAGRGPLAGQLARTAVRDVRRTAAPSWNEVTVEAGQALDVTLAVEGVGRDRMRFRWAGETPPWPSLSEDGRVSSETLPRDTTPGSASYPLEVAGADGRWVAADLTVTITEPVADHADTKQVSLDADGGGIDDHAWATGTSADGSAVAWTTGPYGSGDACYVTDVATGVVTRADVDSDGLTSTSTTNACSLSADGRYVVFDAEGLDGFPGRHVFRRDLDTGATTLVSASADGTPANASSYGNPRLRQISDDGTRVAFESDATNLHPDGWADLFVKDLTSGEVAAFRLPAPGPEVGYQMTGDGSVVLVDRAEPSSGPDDTTLRVPVTVRSPGSVESNRLVEVPDTPTPEWSVADFVAPATSTDYLVFGLTAAGKPDRLVRVDLSTGEAVTLDAPDRPDAEVSIEASVSADGSRVATSGLIDAGEPGERPVVLLWEEGKGTRVLTDTSHLWLDSLRPEIAADGSSVAFGTLEHVTGAPDASAGMDAVWMPLP